MTYIDCYLAPVPCENRAAYENMAKISAQIVKEHRALRVSDPRMQFQDRPPAFDGKRLIAAGFKPMLDESREV